MSWQIFLEPSWQLMRFGVNNLKISDGKLSSPGVLLFFRFFITLLTSSSSLSSANSTYHISISPAESGITSLNQGIYVAGNVGQSREIAESRVWTSVCRQFRSNCMECPIFVLCTSPLDYVIDNFCVMHNTPNG